MTIYLNTGPFLTIPDQVHPGRYRVIHNPDWDGELPEIVSFTNFLKWNYILEYGNFIRKLHSCHQLPLPWYFTGKVDIIDVAIKDGKYERTDHDSFFMYVICSVVFNVNGCQKYQEYVVHGVYHSYGNSNFFCDAELYNGEYIRIKRPLDEFLVPILTKKDYVKIAEKMLEKFYPYRTNYPCSINTASIAESMGLDIQYAHLSKNCKVKSKLILDKRNTTVYDENESDIQWYIDRPTILVEKRMEKTEIQNAIIHECVHAYLHHFFYELQSYYRKMVGRRMPEFNDYFYSQEQQDCLKWMETQATAIPRLVQMPEDETSDYILNFFDNFVGEPDWEDYRRLIDLVKWKFGVSRNAAKKRIIELG